MKTKITAALLTAVILFTFAACGKSEDGSTTSAATTIQTTSGETGTTAAETTTAAEATQTQTDSRTAADTTAATTKATTQPATTTAPAVKTFSAAQLAEFNGKNGKASYLAYDGTVYDVSDQSAWASGSHYGLDVGTDVTAQVKACSKHVKAFIEAQFNYYPKVGTYTG